MSSPEKLDDMQFVDKLLHQLRYQHSGPYGAGVTGVEINRLVQLATQALLKEKTLVDVTPPITICGDIHGQYKDLLYLMDGCRWPPETRYLFLGDYVDRGPRSVETICLLLSLKVHFPDDVVLLRGNHECRAINRTYGFYAECMERYGPFVWNLFHKAFSALPFCALVGGRIFCMHGGLPRGLRSLDYIRGISRPIEPPEKGILCDLLWSDPKKGISGWQESARGAGHLFGADVVEEYCRKFDIDLIVRAHQVMKYGFRFFANKRLITVFSAPNYTGHYKNAAAVVHVDDHLICRIHPFRRDEPKRRKKNSRKKPVRQVVDEDETDETSDDSSEEEDVSQQASTSTASDAGPVPGPAPSNFWVQRTLVLLDEMFGEVGFAEYHPGQPDLPKSWARNTVRDGGTHLSYRSNKVAVPIEITVTIHKSPHVNLHLKAHEFIGAQMRPFDYQMDTSPEFEQIRGEELDKLLREQLHRNFFDKLIEATKKAPASGTSSEESGSDS